MRVTSRVFSLIGLGFLAAGFFILSQKISFWYTAQTATATVIDFKASGPDSNGYDECPDLLHPVVCFVTPRGDSVRIGGAAGSMVPTYQMGQQVTLRYDPAHPRQVEFPDFLSRWGAILLSVVVGGMGAVALRVGLNRY